MAKKRGVKKRGASLVNKIGAFNFAIAALAAAFAGQFMAYNSGSMLAPGLVLFAVAAVLFILSHRAAVGVKELKEPGPFVEALLLVAIIGVAVFFRVYMIDELPSGCFRDEGQNGNEAINILTGKVLEGTSLPVYIERWTQNAAMYMYLVAVSFKAFGIGVMQIRVVSIVLGILCVPAFYFLIRRFFGVYTAAAAALLLAVMNWHVIFSRVGFLGILTVLIVILAFYFAYRAYKEGGLTDYCLLGFLTALALYSYIAARLLPAGLAVVIVYLIILKLLGRKRKRENPGVKGMGGLWKREKLFSLLFLGAFTTAVIMYFIPQVRAWHFLFPAAAAFGAFVLFRNHSNTPVKAAMALLVFIVTLGPLGQYALKHPSQFMSRASTVSIFNKEMLREIGGRYVEKDGVPKHWTKLYAENVKNTLLMFNYKGDGNPRHNYPGAPMLDFLSGIFLVLGFGFALYKWREPLYFFMLVMTAAFMQGGLFSTESPQAYRTIPLIPVALFFAAAAIKVIKEAFVAQFKRDAWLPLLLSAVLAFGFIIYENYTAYFKKFYNNPGSWAEFSVDEYHMGRYVRGLGSDYFVVINPAWMESYTFKFASYPSTNYSGFDLSEWMPVKSRSRNNYAYILEPEYLPLVPVLKSMYPNGKYHDFRHKFFSSRILYWVYEVPYEDVVKQQEKTGKNGLTGYYYRDNIKKPDRQEALKLSNHWQGEPVITRIDPFILFNWTRDPVMGPFSVKWKGKVKIDEPGEYTFITHSNDYSDVFINGKQILVNKGTYTGAPPGKGTVKLSKGMHDIQVRFYQSVHYTKMQLWWKTPSGSGEEVVPSEALFP